MCAAYLKASLNKRHNLYPLNREHTLFSDSYYATFSTVSFWTQPLQLLLYAFIIPSMARIKRSALRPGLKDQPWKPCGESSGDVTHKALDSPPVVRYMVPGPVEAVQGLFTLTDIWHLADVDSWRQKTRSAVSPVKIGVVAGGLQSSAIDIKHSG